MATAPTGPRRPIAVDRPCRACGEPIYFNYKGPIEGLCGRCTDRERARRLPVPARRHLRLPRLPRAAARALVFLAVFLAGVAVGVLLRPYLPIP